MLDLLAKHSCRDSLNLLAQNDLKIFFYTHLARVKEKEREIESKQADGGGQRGEAGIKRSIKFVERARRSCYRTTPGCSWCLFEALSALFLIFSIHIRSSSTEDLIPTTTTT